MFRYTHILLIDLLPLVKPIGGDKATPLFPRFAKCRASCDGLRFCVDGAEGCLPVSRPERTLLANSIGPGIGVTDLRTAVSGRPLVPNQIQAKWQNVAGLESYTLREINECIEVHGSESVRSCFDRYETDYI